MSRRLVYYDSCRCILMTYTTTVVTNLYTELITQRLFILSQYVVLDIYNIKADSTSFMLVNSEAKNLTKSYEDFFLYEKLING